MINIVGASGHSKVILDILLKNRISVEAVWDDNKEIKDFCGIICLGSINDFERAESKTSIIGIGNNITRKTIASKLKDKKFTTALHPSAQISDSVSIGEGTVVMANVSVNAYTQIGEHCILNTACSIDHDCRINNFVHISPKAALAGNVSVGEGTHIGIGACVIQGIKIGKWVTIGAGAVVIKDIPDYAVVVGNPARIIKYNTKHE